MDRRVIVLVCSAAGGCIHAIEQEAITEGRVTRDCVVPPPEGVTGLGAPVSVELPDASLWIWPLVATDRGLVENASALVRDASELCTAGPELARADDGRPATLLAPSTDERERDANRTDGKQLWLEPTGGFSDAGTAYVFYRFQEGVRFQEAVTLGSGLCAIRPGVDSCERIRGRDGFLLWPADERVLDQGGFVADGRALVYGCRPVAALSRLCTVTGVPLDRLTDPAAYQVYNVFEGWVDELVNASAVTDELGAVTVSRYLDDILLTTIDIFEQRVFVRGGASFAEFGDRTDLFGITRTEAMFPSGGREHVGLRRDEHELHVSYAVERAGEVELHLATFLFDRDWRATP